MILLNHLLVTTKSTWPDPGSCYLIFWSQGSRLNQKMYPVISSFHHLEVNLTRSGISSSWLLVTRKSTWPEPGSFYLIFSSLGSRLDQIHDLVISSFRHYEVDLTRSRILLSHLLVTRKTTLPDRGSCYLIFLSLGSRLDQIEDLVISSSAHKEVDLTRYTILLSHLLVTRMSTWPYPGSCYLVFCLQGSRLNQIYDLVISSSLH